MAYLNQSGETFEGFRDLSWHGNVHTSIFVIIVNGKSIEVLLFNYHEDFVIFLKSFTEMIIVGTVKVFDTKIINTDISFLRCIIPKACIFFAGDITMRSKVIY